MWPSFSSSAITQSVTHGIPTNGEFIVLTVQNSGLVHLAYKQSIMPLINSSLFCRLKLIKLVSMRTRYGGESAVLCCKNRAEGACWLCKVQALCRKFWRRDVHTPNSLFLDLFFFLFLFDLVLASAMPAHKQGRIGRASGLNLRTDEHPLDSAVASLGRICEFSWSCPT